MRGIFSMFLFLIAAAAFADEPKIPRTNDVVRYERLLRSGWQLKEISRERGDALLAILNEVKHWERISWNLPPDTIADPAPARQELDIVLTNGSKWEIGLDDGFIVFPWDAAVNCNCGGYYGVPEKERQAINKIMDELDADLRQEVLNTPKPFVYIVGTIDDGGTLSGVARLFYGDPNKWHQLYEANRKTIKNPNILNGTEKLVIPKL